MAVGHAGDRVEATLVLVVQIRMSLLERLGAEAVRAHLLLQASGMGLVLPGRVRTREATMDLLRHLELHLIELGRHLLRVPDKLGLPQLLQQLAIVGRPWAERGCLQVLVRRVVLSGSSGGCLSHRLLMV